MLISHRCRFIIFADPLTHCDWVQQAFAPWSDQEVAPFKTLGKTVFFHGMSPTEAEVAFARRDLPFNNYTRIALVQNPFRRMVHLYDRIAATDPVWRIRRRLGLPVPDFRTWLEYTKPDSHGAARAFGPRWRRFGAWSTTAWANDRVTHFVRAETANDDLRRVFGRIGVTPLFQAPDQSNAVHKFREMLRYDTAAIQIIRDRYAADLKLYHSAAPELRLVA